MDKGIVGLKNRGNTCYLNTSIQCLSNIPELTEYFNSNSYIADLNNRFKETKDKKLNEIILTKEYGKLIKAMWTNTSSIEPKTLHEAIQRFDDRFSGYDQQDSQESLALILDYLHEGLQYDVEITFSGNSENSIDEIMIESIKNWKIELREKYSVIVELFFGQFINKVISLDPKNKNELISKTYEVFNMVTIPIHGRTLYDSLAKYFEKEVLETKYFDEDKNEHVNACRQIKLMKVPKYLILILKRYSGNLSKSNNLITFPIENLDLSSYAEGYDKYDCMLNLVSVGCHQGGLNGGHYYSVCKNINNKWYTYNDDIVTEFNMQTGKNDLFKNGYILIYQKIDT